MLKSNMKLEKQVVSLELAKKLKELGFEQESLFYWCQVNHSILKVDMGKKFWEVVHKDNHDCWNIERISAYTVAELGEMLPDKILFKERPTYFQTKKVKDSYTVEYRKLDTSQFKIAELSSFAETEADARAKMAIFLKEEKLI